ncbi:MAG: hypothetical protein IID45_03500 [Planctomycetes bacterium]|nr:hypothetical protein [Planctomycetota bacterium]
MPRFGRLSVLFLALLLMPGCATSSKNAAVIQNESFFRGRHLTQKQPSSQKSDLGGLDKTPERLPERKKPNEVDSKPTRDTGPKLSSKPTKARAKLDLVVTVVREKQVGSQALFRLELRNLGDSPVDDVVIECRFEKNLIFPGHAETTVVRKMGTLAIGAKRTMQLSLLSRSVGTHCCEFTVRSGTREIFWKSVCVRFVPRQTRIRVFAPPMRTLGDRAEFTFAVQNVSKQNWRDVNVSVEFDQTVFKLRDAGNGTRKQSGRLTWKVPSLNAGRTKYFQFEVECLKQAENACVQISVGARDVPADSAEICLHVAGVSGPLEMQIADTADLLTIGGETDLLVSVKNRDGKPHQPGPLTVVFPANFRVLSATVWQGNRKLQVTSNVKGTEIVFAKPPRLNPNADLTYRIRLKAVGKGIGEFRATLPGAAGSQTLKLVEPVVVR